MKTSERGLTIIKSFEGVKYRAYLCPAGVWTIGYGHTKGVKEGDTCTSAQADEWLQDDLSASEEAIGRLVQVPLTQGQFDALVSFVFNLGSGNLDTSTLLRKLNARDYPGAADQFPRWNKAKGKVERGLTRRRQAERLLFLEP